MKSIIKCKIVIILMFVTCSFIFGNEKRVYDNANLLTKNEIADLEARIESATNEIKMDLVLLTITDAEGKMSLDYADDFYDYNDFGTGKDKSGALFLIDMDNREIYISTSGNMIDLLTDERIEAMLDNAYAKVSVKDYYGTFESFLDDLQKYFSVGIEKGQYRYDTETGKITKRKTISINEIIFALLVSVAVALFIVFCIYKSYAKKPREFVYKVQNNANLSLYQNKNEANSNIISFLGALAALNIDTFINKVVTSRVIKTHTSSGGTSGRSSTHTSSSGRSHGGGGRKF